VQKILCLRTEKCECVFNWFETTVVNTSFPSNLPEKEITRGRKEAPKRVTLTLSLPFGLGQKTYIDSKFIFFI